MEDAKIIDNIHGVDIWFDKVIYYYILDGKNIVIDYNKLIKAN